MKRWREGGRTMYPGMFVVVLLSSSLVVCVLCSLSCIVRDMFVVWSMQKVAEGKKEI